MVSTGITTPTTGAFLKPAMTDGCVITNDIGTVIGKTAELSDYDRLNLLNNAFVPSNHFEWLYQNRTSKGNFERRYLKKEHFDRCRFLTFSLAKGELFCRYCVLFVEQSKGQKYESLVIKPFTNYARMFGSQGAINKKATALFHREN